MRVFKERPPIFALPGLPFNQTGIAVLVAHTASEEPSYLLNICVIVYNENLAIETNVLGARLWLRLDREHMK